MNAYTLELPEAVVTALPPAAPSSPYKFLDYFEESDWESFAGRDRDILDALARISRSRTFVIFGRSGLGKTSFLKAGLFPRLIERDYRPIYIRTLTAPLQDLQAAVADALGGPVGGSVDELRDCLRQTARESRNTIVLVMDQFEEFFIRFRDQEEERATFIDAIGSLVGDQTLDLRVVFSLREDYLAELDDFRRVLPRILDNEQRLLSLSAFGAREAILRPIQRANVDYSQGLVPRLVDELSEVGFDPTLLQVVCSEVFHQAARRDSTNLCMTEKDLADLGGLEGIFRRYLDGVTKAIPRERILVARAVLDTLITEENTKQAVSLAHFSSTEFLADAEEIQKVLEVLALGRLVRPEDRNGEPWYELIHERLVRYVREWLDRDPEYVNFRAAFDLVNSSARGSLWKTNSAALFDITGVIRPHQQRLRLDPSQVEYVFRCAVIHRSPDAGFWAERLGFDAARPILLSNLSSQDPKQRLGAALVAGNVADPEGQIAAACQALVDDPDPEVRHAAGGSWARLLRTHPRAGRNGLRRQKRIPSAAPSPSEPSGLRKGLSIAALAHWLKQPRERWKSLRQEAEFLAGALVEGGLLPRVPYWQRLWARRIADQRAIKDHAVCIKAKRVPGALVGLAAGFGWAHLVNLPILWIASRFEGFDGLSEMDDLIFKVVWLPMLVGLGGAVLGWITAVASARETAARGDGFRPFRLLRSRILLGSCTLLVMYLALTQANLENVFTGIAIAVGGVGAALAMVEGATWLILRSVRPARRWQIWLWTWFACVGLPFSVGLLVNYRDAMRGQWPAMTSGASSVASFLLATIVIARYFAPRWASVGPTLSERAPSRLARWICGASFALFAVLCLGLWLRDASPRWAPAYLLEPGSELSIPVVPKPGLPALAWNRLRLPMDALIETTPEVQWVLEIGGTRKSSFDRALRVSSIFYAPAGTATIGIQRTEAQRKEPGRSVLKVKVKSPVVGYLSDQGSSHRIGSEPVTIAVPLERGSRTSNVWSGSLKMARTARSGMGRLEVTLRSYGEILPREAISIVESKITPEVMTSIPAPTTHITRPTGLVGYPEDFHSLIIVTESSESEEWRLSIRLQSDGIPTHVETLPLFAEVRWLADKDRRLASLSHGPSPKPEEPQPLNLVELYGGPLAASGDEVRSLRAALADAPTSISLHLRLARLYQVRGDLGSVISEMQRVVELEPAGSDHLKMLARQLCLAGRFLEALPVAMRAKELAPEALDIQDTVAHVHYGLGHWREAVQAWSGLPGSWFAAPDDSNCVDDLDLFEDAKRRTNQGPSLPSGNAIAPMQRTQ